MTDHKTQRKVVPDKPAEKEPQIRTLDQVLKRQPVEIGGPAGPEPTRYGDWERKGRCIDF